MFKKEIKVVIGSRVISIFLVKNFLQKIQSNKVRCYVVQIMNKLLENIKLFLNWINCRWVREHSYYSKRKIIDKLLNSVNKLVKCHKMLNFLNHINTYFFSQKIVFEIMARVYFFSFVKEDGCLRKSKFVYEHGNIRKTPIRVTPLTS